MTYEEIVAKVKKEFGSADVSKYEGHLALQINITGEGSGAFYAEINDGQLFIEPFDYKDNDAILTASGEDIVNILSGNLGAVEAFEAGKITVDGDISKALLCLVQAMRYLKSVRTFSRLSLFRSSFQESTDSRDNHGTEFRYVSYNCPFQS